jgi:hypothetical protein
VPYRPTPKLTQDISALSREINKVMDKAGLYNIGVRVKNNLQYMVDGTLKDINGSYLNQIITLSLDNPNIMGTLHHEIIHALKAMGMFSDKEWAVLTKKAKEQNGWIYKYEINRRYPKASEEIKIEEAVASAAADYINMGGAPKALLARIKEFFDRLVNALQGRGFMTSDMVFNRTPEAIFRKAIEGRLEGPKEAKQGELRADVRKATESFNRWFGNSKVVDKNGEPLVVYHGTDRPDFDIFNPASWFSDSAKESTMYTRYGDLKNKERLLNKYKLSDDTSVIGQRIPIASVLSDFDKLEEGKLYAEGGEDGPVYKYLGNNKFEVLKNVVVDLDSANYDKNGDTTILLKKGFSQEAIDTINEAKNYANEFTGGEGGRVYPVYLSIKNPKYLDAMEANAFSERLGKSKEDIKKQIDKWKSQGYDGIITESDEATFFPEVKEAFGGIPKQYIPFDSSQIKSATGNNGEYSLENPDIRAEIPMDGVSPDFAKSINVRFGAPKKVTIKEKFEELKPNFFDRLITGVFDEFHTIKKYSQDAYMKAVLSKSVDGALDGLLMQGQVYIKDGALDIKQGTKGLLEIMKPLGTDVERYQVWKALNRDAEVARKYDAWKALAPKDRGKEPASPSFPAAEVAQRDQLINGNINGVPRAKLFRTALNEENALNRSVLDVAKQQGVIDQEAYNRFANDIYYIPFYKEMEDGQIMSVQDSSKLTGQYFSKALKGGEKERMGDLMENVLRNWSHILSASMKNAAANSTLLAAENLQAAVQVKSTYEVKDRKRVV